MWTQYADFPFFGSNEKINWENSPSITFNDKGEIDFSLISQSWCYIAPNILIEIMLWLIWIYVHFSVEDSLTKDSFNKTAGGKL